METTTTKRHEMLDRIQKHGNNLLAIFPRATERDPVKLCKALRRLESQGEQIALDLCNGENDERGHAILERLLLLKVNKLLGNVRKHQPKTGAACGCKRGVIRDNCPNCEGTGRVIDFPAIRNAPPVVPIFLNGDPRGYALKIPDDYVRDNDLNIHRDWGGYGIIAPDLADN